jgi:hypothetical protein
MAGARRGGRTVNTFGVGRYLPAAVRPSLVIQRRALSDGVFGPSRFWKLVALVLFLRGPLRSTFGRQPERLGAYRIGKGESISVASYRPTTRRQAKHLGLTKAKLYDEARAELDSMNAKR